jgi:hypothetical protein
VEKSYKGTETDRGKRGEKREEEQRKNLKKPESLIETAAREKLRK